MAKSTLVASYVLAYFIRPATHEVLLTLRGKEASFGTGYYGLVGGKVEDQESPTEAMEREVLEETGCMIRVKESDIRHIYYFKDLGDDCVVYIFEVSAWEGEITNCEPHKHETLEWFSFDELPMNLLPRHKDVLDALKDKRFYQEWGFER